MRIRHVAVCTSTPWETEEQVQRLLGLAVVVRDPVAPPINLRNGVFALHSTFLEVSAPGLPEAPMARFLERNGDGGYMVCLQVDDLASARARAEQLGIRVIFEVDDHKVGDARISSVHLHPADTGGTLFSFEQPTPTDSWAYGGDAWTHYRRCDAVRDVVGVELACRRPAEVAERLAALLDIPFKEYDGQLRLELDQGAIVLTQAATDASQDRLAAIWFAASDPAAVGQRHRVAGTTFALV